MDQFYISDSKWINLRSVQYINGMIHYDHFNWPRGVEKKPRSPSDYMGDISTCLVKITVAWG